MSEMNYRNHSILRPQRAGGTFSGMISETCSVANPSTTLLPLIDLLCRDTAVEANAMREPLRRVSIVTIGPDEERLAPLGMAAGNDLELSRSIIALLLQTA